MTYNGTVLLLNQKFPSDISTLRSEIRNLKFVISNQKSPIRVSSTLSYSPFPLYLPLLTRRERTRAELEYLGQKKCPNSLSDKAPNQDTQPPKNLSIFPPPFEYLPPTPIGPFPYIPPYPVHLCSPPSSSSVSSVLSVDRPSRRLCVPLCPLCFLSSSPCLRVPVLVTETCSIGLLLM